MCGDAWCFGSRVNIAWPFACEYRYGCGHEYCRYEERKFVSHSCIPILFFNESIFDNDRYLGLFDVSFAIFAIAFFMEGGIFGEG
jgi:hypothetical protein